MAEAGLDFNASEKIDFTRQEILSIRKRR